MAAEPFNPIEQQAWRSLVAVMTRLSAAMDTELLRECGVSHFEYRVLSVLSEQPTDSRLPLIELAALVDASLSRLSHVVTNLERRALVDRRRSQTRRGRDAALTALGRREVQGMTPVYVAVVRGLAFDGLTEHEVQQLSDVMQGLLAQVVRGTGQGVGLPGRPSNRIPTGGA